MLLALVDDPLGLAFGRSIEPGSLKVTPTLMPMMSLTFFWMFDFNATRASCSEMVVTSSMERMASETSW